VVTKSAIGGLTTAWLVLAVCGCPLLGRPRIDRSTTVDGGVTESDAGGDAPMGDGGGPDGGIPCPEPFRGALELASYEGVASSRPATSCAIANSDCVNPAPNSRGACATGPLCERAELCARYETVLGCGALSLTFAVDAGSERSRAAWEEPLSPAKRDHCGDPISFNLSEFTHLSFWIAGDVDVQVLLKTAGVVDGLGVRGARVLARDYFDNDCGVSDSAGSWRKACIPLADLIKPEDDEQSDYSCVDLFRSWAVQFEVATEGAQENAELRGRVLIDSLGFERNGPWQPECLPAPPAPTQRLLIAHYEGSTPPRETDQLCLRSGVAEGRTCRRTMPNALDQCAVISGFCDAVEIAGEIQGSGGLCVSYATDHPVETFRGRGTSLRLDFDVSGELIIAPDGTAIHPYAGYSEKLVSNDPDRCQAPEPSFDLTATGLQAGLLSFWIRQSDPDIDMEIGIKSAGQDPQGVESFGPKRKPRLSDFRNAENICGRWKDGWTKICIPIEQLQPSWQGATRREVSLENLWEWNFAATPLPGSPLRGSVWLDELAIEAR
jgi:hypothetical protein